MGCFISRTLYRPEVILRDYQRTPSETQNILDGLFYSDTCG